MTFQQAYDPFRALGSVWNIAKRGPWSILLGSVLLWACQLGQQHTFKMDFEPRDIESAKELLNALLSSFRGLTAVLALLGCGLALASWLFECLLRIGFATVIERALMGERDDPARLFDARERYATMVLTTFLQSCILCAVCIPGIAFAGLAGFGAHALTHEVWVVAVAAVTVAVLYMPVVIYFGLGISLAAYAVAIEGMSTGEAFSRAWSLARGHRWQLLVYWLVLVVFQVVCCACCFIVVPACFIATNDSYLRLVRGGEPATWPKSV